MLMLEPASSNMSWMLSSVGELKLPSTTMSVSEGLGQLRLGARVEQVPQLECPFSSSVSVSVSFSVSLCPFSPLCLSVSLPLSHSHSHTLLISCTCCYDQIKGTQDKDFSYSFSDSLSASLCLSDSPRSHSAHTLHCNVHHNQIVFVYSCSRWLRTL